MYAILQYINPTTCNALFYYSVDLNILFKVIILGKCNWPEKRSDISWNLQHITQFSLIAEILSVVQVNILYKFM